MLVSETVIRKKDQGQKLSKRYLYSEGEEVLAIASLNKDPVVSYSAELVRNKQAHFCGTYSCTHLLTDFQQLRIGKMPKASELRKGVNPLDIPLTV